MRNRADVTISDAAAEYLNRCARIRNVSRRSLLRRLLEIISSDQMVGSILDDADSLRQRRPSEPRFKEIPDDR